MPVDDSGAIVGLDVTKRRLEAAVRDSTRAIARRMQSAGMRRSPVKTGTLRRSWYVHPRAENEYHVGPSTVYARRIELGFMNMRDSLGRLYHQPARPYVRPAFAETLAVARDMTVARIRAALVGG